MDKVLFYVLIFIVIYVMFFNNNNKEHFDNISEEWKNTIKYQCDRLTKEIDVINNLLGECSTNKDINGKVNCRDFEEIQINSDREKNAWCGLNNYVSPEHKLNNDVPKVDLESKQEMQKDMPKDMQKDMQKDVKIKETFTNDFDIQGYDYKNKYN